VLAARGFRSHATQGRSHLQVVLSFMARSHCSQASERRRVCSTSQGIADAHPKSGARQPPRDPRVFRGDEARASELIEPVQEAASRRFHLFFVVQHLRRGVYFTNSLGTTTDARIRCALAEEDSNSDDSDRLRPHCCARARRGGIKDPRQWSDRHTLCNSLTRTRMSFGEWGAGSARVRAPERRRDADRLIPRVDRAPRRTRVRRPPMVELARDPPP